MRMREVRPRPQDMIKLRCEFTSDEDLFKVGKIYDGFWPRWVCDDGTERFAKGYAPIDENGESYNTDTGGRWFRFTIVEGPTEPPKE